jgi:TPR repeat protein
MAQLVVVMEVLMIKSNLNILFFSLLLLDCNNSNHLKDLKSHKESIALDSFDIKKSVKDSVEKPGADSILNIAFEWLYKDIEDTELKKDSANYYFRLSLKKNSPKAYSLYGCELLSGTYLNKDTEQGLVLLNNEILNHDAQSKLCLSYYYFSINDIDTGVSFLKMSDSLGNIYAGLDLANVLINNKLFYSYYQKNIPITINYDKGLFYAEKSAKKGNIDAQYFLGAFYFTTKHLQRNFKKAKYYLNECIKNSSDNFELKQEAKNILSKIP